MYNNWKNIIEKNKVGILENIYNAKLKTIDDNNVYCVVLYNDGTTETIMKERMESDYDFDSSCCILVYETPLEPDERFELIRDMTDVMEYCMDELNETVEFINDFAEDFETEEKF